jgi:hypothetical protein
MARAVVTTLSSTHGAAASIPGAVIPGRVPEEGAS